MTDVLRFALAVLVIYSHSYALLTGSDRTEPLYVWTRGQITFGGVAVDAFFILSGYLITHSWLRSDGLFDYLRKRVLRIYPGFAVAVAFGVLWVAPFSSRGGITIDAVDWVVSTLNLRGYEPSGAFDDVPFRGSLNGSLWSISYEFWCYVGVAFLGLSSLLARCRLVLLAWLLSIALSIAFVAFRWNPGGAILGVIFGDPRLWARLLPYYLAGCLCCLYRDHIRMTAPLGVLSIALLGLGAILPSWGVAFTFPAALAYLLLFIGRMEPKLLRGFTKYGDFSYGIYLYAFPLQQLLVRHVPDLTPLRLFLLATPPTLLAAVLSWHLVEKDFIKLKAMRAAKPTFDSAPRAQRSFRAESVPRRTSGRTANS
jgi:peptidoglycan/LPS O-acetylase OafA/YrhL